MSAGSGAGSGAGADAPGAGKGDAGADAASDAGSRGDGDAPPRFGPRLGRPRWGLIAIGYLAALAAGWLYGLGVVAGGAWNEGAAWERSLLLAVHRQRPDVLSAVLYAIPWAGTNLTLGPAIGIMAGWLLWKRRADLAIWIGVVELGVLTLNWAVKHLLVRDRPDLFERVGWFGWASYPSGHSMASLAVVMTVALLAHRATGRRWPVVAAFLLFAAVSYSRLVHGVHWPTDIIGGALVGLVWLVATWLGFVRLPERDRRRSRGSG